MNLEVLICPFTRSSIGTDIACHRTECALWIDEFTESGCAFKMHAKRDRTCTFLEEKIRCLEVELRNRKGYSRWFHWSKP